MLKHGLKYLQNKPLGHGWTALSPRWAREEPRISLLSTGQEPGWDFSRDRTTGREGALGSERK